MHSLKIYRILMLQLFLLFFKFIIERKCSTEKNIFIKNDRRIILTKRRIFCLSNRVLGEQCFAPVSSSSLRAAGHVYERDAEFLLYWSRNQQS